MRKKIACEVQARRMAIAEDHTRVIFANDEVTASEPAILRARQALFSLRRPMSIGAVGHSTSFEPASIESYILTGVIFAAKPFQVMR
jgi:hypothetical protein